MKEPTPYSLGIIPGPNGVVPARKRLAVVQGGNLSGLPALPASAGAVLAI